MNDDEAETAREADDVGTAASPQDDSEEDPAPHIEEALETLPDGSKLRGEVVAVERVDSSAVPEDVPYEVAGDALALTLDIDHIEGEATTYFTWPDAGADDRLERLLWLREFGPDQVTDFQGAQMLLTVENGHVVPVLPETKPRGDERAYVGILVGLLPSLLIFLSGLFGAGDALFTQAFVGVWAAGTFLVLPVSLYLDAWHLRTTMDWRGRPLLWAGLSVIPAVNVMAVSAYLVLRQSADPLT